MSDWPEANDPDWITKMKTKCQTEAERKGISIETYMDRLALELIFEHGIPEKIVKAARGEAESLNRKEAR